MNKLLAWLGRLRPKTYEDGYWDGRRSGWRDCESMIVDRIKEHYPEEHKKIWEKLVQ